MRNIIHNRRLPALGFIVKTSMMKNQDFAFGSVCGHMLPGAEWHPHPPLEIRGQGPATSIHPPDLKSSTPRSTSCLLSILTIRTRDPTALHMLQVPFTERQMMLTRQSSSQESPKSLYRLVFRGGCDASQGCCSAFALKPQGGADCKLGFITGKWTGQVPAVATSLVLKEVYHLTLSYCGLPMQPLLSTSVPQLSK